MNIDDLTLGQLKEIQALTYTKKADCTYLVGKNIMIRTVTMIFTGKLISVTNDCFVLVECSWIPDTGRWMGFIENGTVEECEPYPSDVEVYINRSALIDMCAFNPMLPRVQK